MCARFYSEHPLHESQIARLRGGCLILLSFAHCRGSQSTSAQRTPVSIALSFGFSDLFSANVGASRLAILLSIAIVRDAWCWIRKVVQRLSDLMRLFSVDLVCSPAVCRPLLLVCGLGPRGILSQTVIISRCDSSRTRSRHLYRDQILHYAASDMITLPWRWPKSAVVPLHKQRF
jgi:hypothetical protein